MLRRDWAVLPAGSNEPISLVDMDRKDGTDALVNAVLIARGDALPTVLPPSLPPSRSLPPSLSLLLPTVALPPRVLFGVRPHSKHRRLEICLLSQIA